MNILEMKEWRQTWTIRVDEAINRMGWLADKWVSRYRELRVSGRGFAARRSASRAAADGDLAQRSIHK